MSTVRVQSIAIVVFVWLTLSVSNLDAARQDAKSLYDKAIAMESVLNRTDKMQQSVSNWKKVIEAFRVVYYAYPSSGYSDNALFHVAVLYSRMAERFHDPLYYRRACSSYKFLIDQYSSSSLADESMIEFIRISRNELKEEKEASEIEELLKRRFPAAASALRKASVSTPVQPSVMKSLRHYTGEEYTRIVIDFDREVSFKRSRISNPDRLYFDFENTVASKSLTEKVLDVDDGFLKQIRVGQNNYRTARVVLDLKSIERYEVFSLYHPFRIIIDVQGTGAKTAALPVTEPAEELPVKPPEAARTNTSGNYSLARQLGLKVRRIIVDPGHGGHDPGAMSGKLREKDITLDVATKLKNILEQSYGYEVLMTRSNDVFVALEERTAFANSNSADLFVSVHVNSSRNRSARGIETYYLNFATSPEAMEVAARENAIAEKNMAELQKLTNAIAMNSKIEESRDFAGLIQRNLVSHLQKGYSPNSLGVKKAPFYVLIGAQMPSILAEISFLSNKNESVLLGTDPYRSSIAEGLAKGVHNYVETLAESKLTQNRN